MAPLSLVVGCYQVSQLLDISTDDLEMIGITLAGHQRKILKSLESLKTYKAD